MASEGKNEVARSLLDLQPTAILELYKIYPDTVNAPSAFFTFHGGSVFGGNVVWQGIQYIPIPVESEGFGVFADGTLPRPKIKIANTDKLVTYFLDKYKDFKNAKVYRKKVFIKHLDDSNFDGSNPFGLANSESEISEEKYLIGQKVQENKAFVEFELNLPLDLDNFDVNHRTVNAKYCYWQYRGLGCRYQGKPVEKDNGETFVGSNGVPVALNINDEFDSENKFYEPNKSYTAGDAVYLENKSVILDRNEFSDPIYHKVWYVCVKSHSGGQHPEDNPSHWQKDGCTKKIEACQKRFSSDSLKKVFFGSSSASFNYIHLKRGAAAVFLSDEGNLLYPFNTQNPYQWTVTLWARGSRQHIDDNGVFTNPSILATNKIDRPTNDQIQFHPTNGNLLGSPVAANLHFSSQNTEDSEKGFDLDFVTRTTANTNEIYKAKSKFADENKFHFICIRGSILDGVRKIEILVNPDRNEYGAVIFSDRMIIDSVSFVSPFQFSLFGDARLVSPPFNEKLSFAGDIAQTCIWRRKLNDDEVVNLATNRSVSNDDYYLTDNNLQKKASDYSQYVPTRYNQATGALAGLTGDGNLVAWYDMETGLQNNELVLLDEHIGANNDLTGFPLVSQPDGTANGASSALSLFEKRTIQYTEASFEDFVPNQNADYVLPFGGFPGTDGYDYRSGPQSI